VTSDVYAFWGAIGASLKTCLDDEDNNFDPATKREIRAIFNFRFRNLFQDGNGDIYVTALYLDPRKYRSYPDIGSTILTLYSGYPNTDLLLKPNPHSATLVSIKQQSQQEKKSGDDDPTKSPVYQRIGNFSLKLLKDEIQRIPRHPDLKKLTSKSIAKDFKAQLATYAKGLYPFNTPIAEGQSVLLWWRTFEGHPLSGALAVSSMYLLDWCLTYSPSHSSSLSKSSLLPPVQWLMNEPCQHLRC